MNEISFSYERMDTKTRSEKEACEANDAKKETSGNILVCSVYNEVFHLLLFHSLFSFYFNRKLVLHIAEVAPFGVVR